MARPTLPLGTYGAIRIYEVPTGFRARTLYRDFDGKTRHVEAIRKTKGAATRALTEALRDRARTDAKSIITGDARFRDVAAIWLASLRDEGRSPSTIQLYGDRLEKQVLPAIGNVRVRELTVGLIDRHLKAVKAKHGNAIAKTSRTVISGICGLAVRHDALLTNPCRDVARISTRPQRESKALDAEQIRVIRRWFSTDATAQYRDLPDLVAFLAGTGLRIGEACALRWTDLDLDEGNVTVRGTVVRLRGQGLMIKPSPKSKAGSRILELPLWCVAMLRRRQAVHGDVELVFAAPRSGTVRDLSNTRRGLREAFAKMGVSDVTSHTFRRSVATLMDEAGLSPRHGADQLGHANPAETMNSYWGRKVRKTGAAEVLEVLGDD